ncbi:MAG: hypothetical protein H0U23_15230 [Blastocatellia bacterium]|nr:hypothetical protein [Blastocatellia bacterium]
MPEWYQRRFLPGGKGKVHYLDLRPETVTREGHSYTRDAMLRWGPPSCFAQEDLYTIDLGRNLNVDVERYFFGDVDSKGRNAVEFFSNFQIRNGLHEAFHDLLRYMSVQKLRTPKGLGWLANIAQTQHRQSVLVLLQYIQTMHCAHWTDAIWQIAEATHSNTKFIVTDHPVTVYNRACFPGSKYCRGYNDPDIRFAASQTLFPLTSEKILILTNLAWVRNPYQSEVVVSPNPNLFHDTVFKATDIQRGRILTEEEVLQINYIMKMRAYRYIASANREELFPETQLGSTHWSKFGDGYLLMPDPRDVHMGGTVYMGYEGSRSEAWDEYGHRPGQKGFEDRRRNERESKALRKFQAEFSALYGPEQRGWSEQFHNEGPRTYSGEYHDHLLSEATRFGFKERKFERQDDRHDWFLG